MTRCPSGTRLESDADAAAGRAAARASSPKRRSSGAPSPALALLLAWLLAPVLDTTPRPVAPPEPEVSAGHAAPPVRAGWLAQRDPRTGELVAASPETFQRLAAAAESGARSPRRVFVERRLPNGAVQIELPESSAPALYGWLDERGELRMGHALPEGAAPPAREDGR
jgi:hypothetical protein